MKTRFIFYLWMAVLLCSAGCASEPVTPKSTRAQIETAHQRQIQAIRDNPGLSPTAKSAALARLGRR